MTSMLAALKPSFSFSIIHPLRFQVSPCLAQIDRFYKWQVFTKGSNYTAG